MTSYAGVLKIARFNWPWYVGAVAVHGAVFALLRTGAVTPAWRAPAIVALAVVDAWLVLSLVVSHWIYDRSPIARGAWLDGVDAAHTTSAAVFHAGQDEATASVRSALPSAQIAVYDFYDPATAATPSLERARAATGHRDPAISGLRAPLADASQDLCLLVFAAHEVRDARARGALFREMRRLLAPQGRLIVVEHLRDAWNFVAYGPGAFHFLTRATWLRAFDEGGLRLVREEACTPFVRIFELARTA